MVPTPYPPLLVLSVRRVKSAELKPGIQVGGRIDDGVRSIGHAAAAPRGRPAPPCLWIVIGGASRRVVFSGLPFAGEDTRGPGPPWQWASWMDADCRMGTAASVMAFASCGGWLRRPMAFPASPEMGHVNVVTSVDTDEEERKKRIFREILAAMVRSSLACLIMLLRDWRAGVFPFF